MMYSLFMSCCIYRSLPEPLMTFRLHQKFINAASMCSVLCSFVACSYFTDNFICCALCFSSMCLSNLLLNELYFSLAESRPLGGYVIDLRRNHFKVTITSFKNAVARRRNAVNPVWIILMCIGEEILSENCLLWRSCVTKV